MKSIDIFALIWLGTLSAVTLLLFGFDKWRARAAGWRVPERNLLLFAAAGGWVGGLLGMQLFRHKSAKGTFQLRYALALVPFVAEIWAWLHWR